MTQAIPTAVLGRTGLKVTRLGFGTALHSGLDDEGWGVLLNSVLDSGINFIDTANDYGVSRDSPAEEHIGRHISGRRSEFYLATKCGCPPGGGEHIWTSENAFRGLHESLGRLKTDYVDVMAYHNPSVEECKAGDLVTVLEEMREQGKVRLDRRIHDAAAPADVPRVGGVRRVPGPLLSPGARARRVDRQVRASGDRYSHSRRGGAG